MKPTASLSPRLASLADSSATLDALLASRRSIRAFSTESVPEPLINDVISQALQAPSWGNIQPYRIALASGALCDALREEISQTYEQAMALTRAPSLHGYYRAWRRKLLPDGEYSTRLKYPQELQRRYAATGNGLYTLLNIRRDDKPARWAQMSRNFRFFDAPSVIFVFCSTALGPYGPLDTGIFVQSLLLAAHARGLGTCVQGSLATWSGPVKRHFSVPEGYGLVCGIAIGFPAEDRINSYRPQRRKLQEVMLARC